jgi:hypothetical protein
VYVPWYVLEYGTRYSSTMVLEYHWYLGRLHWSEKVLDALNA